MHYARAAAAPAPPKGSPGDAKDSLVALLTTAVLPTARDGNNQTPLVVAAASGSLAALQGLSAPALAKDKDKAEAGEWALWGLGG